MHELVKHDAQFDWTHRFYHSNDWVAVAARHLVDELNCSPEGRAFDSPHDAIAVTGPAREGTQALGDLRLGQQRGVWHWPSALSCAR